MEVGGVSEVVSVQADAAVVDLGKVDVGRNLNEREIHNLPLVSRNPYNFALLQPGVSGFGELRVRRARASAPTARCCASTTRWTATPTRRRIAPACA